MQLDSSTWVHYTVYVAVVLTSNWPGGGRPHHEHHTEGPIIIVALKILYRNLDTQQIRLQHPTIMSKCYSNKRSYGPAAL